MTGFWDRLGISTSLLCVLHCLLAPFLVVVAPLFSHSLMHGWFHSLIVAIVVPVAGWAFWSGYRRHHSRRVLLTGVPGIAAMLAAISLTPHDQLKQTVFMVCGGLLLVFAHLLNLRECRCVHQ